MDDAPLFVVAIDFGTTYSGYAYCSKHDFKEDPPRVFAFENWVAGGQGMSKKTPTCLLLTPEKEFHAFGYEAENEYNALAASKEHKEWYFFKRFKMKLHGEEDIGDDFMIEDEMGKPLPAIDVFSKSIRSLKEHFLDHVLIHGIDIKENEIRWILTVPAIWSDPSKRFMRKAAVKAGLKARNIKIALEPEAASIFCQHLKTERSGPGSLCVSGPGTKYMIIDIGDLDLDKAVLDDVLAAGGGHASHTFVNLAHSMSRHLIQSRSEGTVKKYFSVFKKWKEFAVRENIFCIPAEPIHVALFLTHLIDKGSSVNVVQSAVYSIKWAHKLRGLVDPTDNHYVKNLVETAKRHNSVPKTKKSIISVEQLVELCQKYHDSTDILVLRDLSLIFLSFAGFLRFQEVISLRCKDIQFFDSYISLFLSQSKTDQYRQGSEVLISAGVTAACPVNMLKRYIHHANISLDSEHFLFKPAFRSNSTCSLIHQNRSLSYTRTRETVISRLKEVVGNINIGLHSMRASGASMVARSEVNERCWKRHGRWKSEQAKDGYIEDSIEKRLEVTRHLNL